MSSSFFARLKKVVRLPVTGQDVCQSLESLIEHGKFDYKSYRLFHSVSIASFSELQMLLRPVAAASDSFFINWWRDISVVGAVSRVFSVPSVSGPSFQVYGYHIDRAFSDPCKTSVSKEVHKRTMSSFVSRSFCGGFQGNLVSKRRDPILLPNNCLSRSPWIRSSANLYSCAIITKKDQLHHVTVQRYFFCHASMLFGFCKGLDIGLRHVHTASMLLSPGSVPDVTYENTSKTEMLESEATLSERKPPCEKNLRLLSGSCYLPHPDKEATGGEDAHFICTAEHAIGVADGVGGWADLGVDAGEYSRELMSNSVAAIQEEPMGSINPARVLEKAHSITKSKGSSTACIIALTNQGLNAINLGDSGFMVVRDGCTIFRSPPQQHDFNFTYQLENGKNGDLPSSGQVFTITVSPGDVIIAGTDGLFDNLYNNEITAVVVHAVRAGLSPQITAQKIAALARQRAQEKDRQTPFSTAAQEAGFRYYGGKLDDITVVVSYIAFFNLECQSSINK